MKIARTEYEFTSSGILCTNHINCRDQLCVNLDTGELIHLGGMQSVVVGTPHWAGMVAPLFTFQEACKGLKVIYPNWAGMIAPLFTAPNWNHSRSLLPHILAGINSVMCTLSGQDIRQPYCLLTAGRLEQYRGYAVPWLGG